MKTIQAFVTIMILLPLLILALRIAYKSSKEQLAKMGMSDLLYMRTMFLGLCFFSIFAVMLTVLMAITGINPTTIAEWLYTFIQ